MYFSPTLLRPCPFIKYFLLSYFLSSSVTPFYYVFISLNFQRSSLSGFPPPNPYNPFPTPICQRAIKAGHPSELSFILLRRVEVTTTQTTWVFSAPYSLTPHHFCLPVPQQQARISDRSTEWGRTYWLVGPWVAAKQNSGEGDRREESKKARGLQFFITVLRMMMAIRVNKLVMVLACLCVLMSYRRSTMVSGLPVGTREDIASYALHLLHFRDQTYLSPEQLRPFLQLRHESTLTEVCIVVYTLILLQQLMNILQELFSFVSITHLPSYIKHYAWWYI